MFERFGDLPLHVLVIHAAVVLLPAAAVAAIVFAVVPKWRWLLRWPVLLLGIGSLVVAFTARQSGKAFVSAKPELGQLVREHESRGDLLFYYSIAFAVVCIAAFLLLTGTSPLASGKGAKTGTARPLELVVSAALVVMSVLVAWQTIRTGDSGARAVWNGTFPE
jgi:energy-coupling factor transporter transmembrane protein EcfT